MAEAMVFALKGLQPAQIGIGVGNLVGVTDNRRCHISPYLRCDEIDPHLGIIKVDLMDGTPLATVWNFAIHGVCFGPDNLYFSSDIMGGASDNIEKSVGGISLFINADAGDIDPASQSCTGGDIPVDWKGAIQIADAVATTRKTIQTSSKATMQAASVFVDFGPTDLNATLGRFDNCTSGGPLDICTLCAILRCDLNVHMPESWIGHNPRFTAILFVINQVSTILVTLPGEPLLELGWEVRNDTAKRFNQTILAGYSNAHMGYFATGNEYDIGGYESQLTFWGYDTAEKIRAGVNKAMSLIKF